MLLFPTSYYRPTYTLNLRVAMEAVIYANITQPTVRNKKDLEEQLNRLAEQAKTNLSNATLMSGSNCNDKTYMV